MTHVWLVRHGPTHEKAFTGWRDVPADLSDAAQIERVSAYLPRDALVISSDLKRAHDTATAIGGDRKRLPSCPALRELNFGHWDGLTFDAVSERDPILSRQYWEEPGDLRAPDGESWNDAAARFGTRLDTLIADHRPAHLVVVAHMGVIMTQIQRAGSMSAYAAMGHQIDNYSTTDMRLVDGHWTLGVINHVP
ncbi:Broad specificity phosphatase PhoE [Cognatiyoonia koreensis]|uniref:Broad specificity phosphatase PhoE n=1 Tax=Cognatiyoonia koreensis TaxID=364200 RepID=A0A1I0QL43_9RHOB|nr:histidine phosphatase family protein [Cognatiyoonia koreensis]SEW27734.1 Broad specificity phosphatase PhoE [Cognatiyoonia koreensis]